MRTSAGAVLSGGAAIAVIAVLASTYVTVSSRGVGLYYGFGVLVNPTFAALLAVGVVATLAATASGVVSPDLGTGVAFGLGLVVLFVVSTWAVSGRVDVFRAPGVYFPAQRWLLVALSFLIVVGAGWYAQALGVFGWTR